MREGELVLAELRWLREREESFCAGMGWRSAPVRWEGGGREGGKEKVVTVVITLSWMKVTDQ